MSTCRAHPPQLLGASAPCSPASLDLESLLSPEQFALYLETLKQWHNPVYGYITSKVWDDDEADEVCCDVWTAIAIHMAIFDPEKSRHGEWPFFWANVMLRRHFARRKRDRLLLEAYARERGADVPRHTLPLVLYWDLLRMTLSGDHPPHQLLAFCLRDLLTFRPREIRDQFSATRLDRLLTLVVNEYDHASHLPSGLVSPTFDPLRERLSFPVRSVVPAQERCTYAALLTRTVNRTTFADYYTDADPAIQAANIGHWCDAVRRRLRNQGCILVASGWFTTVED